MDIRDKYALAQRSKFDALQENLVNAHLEAAAENIPTK